MVETLNKDELARALIARLHYLESFHMTHLPKHKVSKKSAGEFDQAIIELLKGSQGSPKKLEILRDEVIGACTRCQLCRHRTNLVFGVGNPNADLVFVGEAPGADEDAQGEPFVGRAGKLLTKMIEAMGFARSDVYICNVIKCRPPENRNPEPIEVKACEPFLKAQLAIIKPKAIVALGRFACQCLMQTETPISEIRGKWTEYEGVPLMPTFHPAYLLRNPPKKREVWEDLQQVIQFLKTPTN